MACNEGQYVTTFQQIKLIKNAKVTFYRHGLVSVIIPLEKVRTSIYNEDDDQYEAGDGAGMFLLALKSVFESYSRVFVSVEDDARLIFCATKEVDKSEDFILREDISPITSSVMSINLHDSVDEYTVTFGLRYNEGMEWPAAISSISLHETEWSPVNKWSAALLLILLVSVLISYFFCHITEYIYPSVSFKLGDNDWLSRLEADLLGKGDRDAPVYFTNTENNK